MNLPIKHNKILSGHQSRQGQASCFKFRQCPNLISSGNRTIREQTPPFEVLNPVISLRIKPQ